MDGLEAVELKLSEVLEDNDTKRIDSEYFKKEYLTFIKLLKKIAYLKLEDISNVKGGKRLPLGENFSDEGIFYIRAEDNKKGFVNYENSPKISVDLHNKLKSYQTKYNDILLTIVGNSIGDVGIVKFNLEKCNLTENCAKVISLKNNLKANYLFSFLNSKFGQLQISRETVGTAQPKLAIERIRKFIISNLNDNFQLQIENLVQSSYKKLEESKILYKEAEEQLLKELDLLDFKPSVENISIKSFSESFGNSGRLDSEYYQAKYDDSITHIKKTKFDKLDNIVNIKKSIEPGSEAYQDSGIPFIRVSNVTKFGISDTDIYLSENILKEEDLQKLYPTKDTILLSKDGTVGIAYKIKNETEMITSGALLHLSIKKSNVLPEYLTLVLNSLIVQLQAQRDAGGSIIKHWKPSEIQEILIPIIDISVQNQIEEKIKKSFELKEESKKLLDLAKRIVEIAIEKDEEEAIKFISNRN
ncbi:restriction endonuclease subunit S [Aliarcobacter butzleri]|uniref:restriction endonuclease subunit S n=1 Tax=Aliarcobacter butzleri TaxID=28197 RepID=UPI0021B29248|nr:restriction endonuclease subunit S [Aliarcobacter butzleri]MCT7550537.1 restriction endonuclease subunit S [Aliarcobacter butzleri]MCT7559633.1 restriction endonuclease subunit S [Aliarcobacter butzleri]